LRISTSALRATVAVVVDVLLLSFGSAVELETRATLTTVSGR
jgi:hypothetical protein